MPKQKTRPQSPPSTSPAGIPVPERGLADMREAADFLMEDAEAVERVLTAAGVPLVHADAGAFVRRHDLRQFRARDQAEQRERLRELTRMSIAMGLDDVDYSSLSSDPS